MTVMTVQEAMANRIHDMIELLMGVEGMLAHDTKGGPGPVRSLPAGPEGGQVGGGAGKANRLPLPTGFGATKRWVGPRTWEILSCSGPLFSGEISHFFACFGFSGVSKWPKTRVGKNMVILVSFNCPRCGRKFESPNSGSKFFCSCGQKLEVPQPPPPPMNKTVLGQLPGEENNKTILGKPEAITAPEVIPTPVYPHDERKTKAKELDEKYCHECGAVIREKAEICPECGVRQLLLAEPYYPSRPHSPPPLPPGVRPHRGVLVMVLGIVGASLAGLGLIVSLLCPFLFSSVGLGLGIASWVMGRNDLKAMENGEMDWRGRGKTKAGCYCGMGATIAGIVAMAIWVVYILYLMSVMSTLPRRF